MRISLSKASAVLAMATAVFLPSASVFADADAEQKAQMEQIEQIERMARMEARLLELEQRLEEAEQTNKEIKVLASNPPSADGSRGSILGNAATFDILAGSAWRDLRWTQEAQWDGVKVGATEEQVIELLGYPPRSVDSRRPRVDKVYWYEASIRDKSSGMSGKVSFRNGRVVSVEKPDFSAKPAAQRQSEAAASRQRLP